MLQLLITVGGALPEASTFVSIYESGSTDSTGEAMQRAGMPDVDACHLVMEMHALHCYTLCQLTDK